mgnify:CR=1 FL=1
MRAWSPAQTRKLLHFVDEHRRADISGRILWDHIAILVGDMRTARECRSRYRRVACDPSPSDFRRFTDRPPQHCRFCGQLRFRHVCTREHTPKEVLITYEVQDRGFGWSFGSAWAYSENNFL